jgi:hypothetical protein
MGDPNENQLCAAADYALTYAIPGVTPAANGWGWNDLNCSTLLPYVCKFPQCELPGQAAARQGAAERHVPACGG